jgi:hypothetical protein
MTGQYICPAGSKMSRSGRVIVAMGVHGQQERHGTENACRGNWSTIQRYLHLDELEMSYVDMTSFLCMGMVI